MLGIGGRKSRNKVIVGEPAIGSLVTGMVMCRVSYECVLYVYAYIGVSLDR